MLARVIEWSIGNRFFVVLGAVFIAFGGIYALRATPLDALPDLSDVQVIIFTDYPGQAPQVVEDQVTYPITTQMLAVPSATVVRGYSFFGFSFVYVIFEDGTDLYWARSRVLEYLNYVGGRLPRGRDADPRPRRHRRRLGVHVRAPLRRRRPRRAALAPGLVPQVRADGGAGGVGGREHRRLRQAVPDHRRPEPPARLRHLAVAHPGRRRTQQQRRRRARPRDVRGRVHGARRGLHPGRRRREARRPRGRRVGHPDHGPRTSPRCRSAPTSAAGSPS